ncbi:MAG: alpha/beta hydrolase [Planctomycetota bacterium]
MKWFARFAGRLLFVALGTYVVFVMVIYFSQRSILYQPSESYSKPQDLGLVGVSEVSIRTKFAHQLVCWQAEPSKGQPTLLFFHGNGGNVSHRSKKFRQLMAVGYGVFMLGYPGYGPSEGEPSEASFLEAAQLAYDYLRSGGIAETQIVIYGASLGSAVAAQLAAKVVCRALILEAPMNSVLEISQQRFPFLPVAWMLKDTYLTSDFINKVEEPVFMIHGLNDNIIPPDSGAKLFERANEPKKRHLVRNAGHNNLYDFPVVEALKAFLDELPRRPLPR